MAAHEPYGSPARQEQIDEVARILGAVFADAIEYRRGDTDGCMDCLGLSREYGGGRLCIDHALDDAQAEKYLEIARHYELPIDG